MTHNQPDMLSDACFRLTEKIFQAAHRDELTAAIDEFAGQLALYSAPDFGYDAELIERLAGAVRACRDGRYSAQQLGAMAQAVQEACDDPSGVSRLVLIDRLGRLAGKWDDRPA